MGAIGLGRFVVVAAVLFVTPPIKEVFYVGLFPSKILPDGLF